MFIDEPEHWEKLRSNIKTLTAGKMVGYTEYLKSLPVENVLDECIELKKEIKDIHYEAQLMFKFLEEMGLTKLFNNYTKDTYKKTCVSRASTIMLYKIMIRSMLDTDDNFFNNKKRFLGQGVK